MSICSLQNNDKVSTTRLPNYLIEIQSFFHSPFFCKKAAQKHGYKSVPHSMADSCCKGWYRWYPCFLFCCHTFLRICRIRSGFPVPPGSRGGKSGTCIQGFVVFLLPKLHSGRNIRDIHDRWEQNPSMEAADFLLHTFILHKHPFFTTFLKNFILKICTVLPSCHFEWSASEPRDLRMD